MAFEYPDNLQYTDTHEYLKIDGDIITIGITEFAIDQLGDVVFLELPDLSDNVEAGEKFGTIESVKAVEDLKSPVNGEVIERNDQLLDAPEQIGDDPYGDGWLIKVKADDMDDLDDDLMTADEYAEQVEGV
ncbi:glycine cleavage system protein GcvH [Leptolyngbya cf. ectocarpi LEGE 11479]|uniref:Glycine cleavage system H protein n=1 Tax=Leptolyngbya cf. ectocarpi LEGE 11479 TaxID=1828722 RepID=A0A928ZYN9_LEPEC|nr:glycine cleavage system protein GcvH [Leptolyngbya ectocarpi]MBE9069934.1 glycine cleavage system protein GcvH [Leptolyngbya cf. ectocarpi LEGE 11479]